MGDESDLLTNTLLRKSSWSCQMFLTWEDRVVISFWIITKSAKMCFIGKLGTFHRSKWFSGQQICNTSLPHYKAGQEEINPTSSTFLKNEHTKNADPVSQRSRLITPVPPEHGTLFKTQIRCVCQIRSQEGLRDHSAAESGEAGKYFSVCQTATHSFF